MDIKEYIQKSIVTKASFLNNTEIIQNAANMIIKAYQNNKKVLIMGNGGSAADSNHIAAEFVSRFKLERKPLAAISLTANQSVITAIANDYDFNKVFSRQIEALGQEGDVLIGISTSGKSQNIIEGFKTAKEKKLATIFLSGKNADFEADCNIKVPSDETSFIQEAHVMIYHIICAKVEENLFKKV